MKDVSLYKKQEVAHIKPVLAEVFDHIDESIKDRIIGEVLIAGRVWDWPGVWGRKGLPWGVEAGDRVDHTLGQITPDRQYAARICLWLRGFRRVQICEADGESNTCRPMFIGINWLQNQWERRWNITHTGSMYICHYAYSSFNCT